MKLRLVLDLRLREVGLLGDVPQGPGLGHEQLRSAANGLALARGGHLQATQPSDVSDQAPGEVELGNELLKKT